MIFVTPVKNPIRKQDNRDKHLMMMMMMMILVVVMTDSPANMTS